GRELDLRPLEIAQLGSPQAVPVTDQDHRRVPMAPAARSPGCSHQPLDLPTGQILAGTNWGIYSVWCRPIGCRNSHGKPPCWNTTSELQVISSSVANCPV